ncbi:hypothetical protein DPMN_113796, partial [Dreissena polymorpha]
MKSPVVKTHLRIGPMKSLTLEKERERRSTATDSSASTRGLSYSTANVNAYSNQ